MMSGELFKKGQIIPKRIGGLHVHSKARHRLVFGCDVLIDGSNWIAMPNTGKSMVTAKKLGIRRNNGTYQSVEAAFKDIHFNANKIDYVVKTYR
ncbi:hypothetical protein ACES27_004606 [Salmonella enterica]|nr:hypothetical protein [Salmonella enterica]